jgi:rubrerythrin
LVDEEPLGKMLLSFADDHRQHVEDLVLLARRGGTDVQPSPPPELRTSSFVALATSFGKLNPRAAIEGLVANEELTGATYDTMLWLITDDEALALLRENREDERRHLEALTACLAKHG